MEIDALTEAVQQALTEHPEADLGMLANRLQIDEAKISIALDEIWRMSLSDFMACGRKPRVSLTSGLTAWFAREQAELLNRLHLVREWQTATQELSINHTTLENEEGKPSIEYYTGDTKIHKLLQGRIDSCKEEACSFVPVRNSDSKNLTAIRSWNRQLLGRGVQVRSVYLDSIRNNRTMWEHACKLHAMGSNIRTAPMISTSLHIFDRKNAVIIDRTEPSNPEAVFLSETILVTTLLTAFHQTWSEGIPIGIPQKPNAQGLSTIEKSLVTLWANGYTDERASRKLGISSRTARRISGKLMTRLGATSRFQAGALTLSRGWLSPMELE